MNTFPALNRRMLTTASLAIAAVLFFAVNVLVNSGMQHTRLDLTSGKLYTLADGTRSILEKLEEPVTLKLYVSKKLATNLPGISSYTLRVEELLREFARDARGKIKLSVIDPEPFSEEEDRAVSYGLQGAPIDDSGSNTFYFGLVGTNSTDKEESIPFFEPSRSDYLEYDLAKLVYQLSSTKQSTVGVLSSIPLEGNAGARLMQPGTEQELVVMEQMKQLFQVRNLETTIDRIPDDINVLMLVHPKDLSEQTLYAIDQFVLRGGRTIVFVDPMAESAEAGGNPMMGAQGPSSSNLTKLFDAWGLRMLPNIAVGDLDAAKKVQFNAGARPVIIDYPVWMDLTEANIAHNDAVTGQLTHVTLATAGILEKLPNATTEFSPLLHTGARSAKIETTRLGAFADPQELMRGFHPEGQFTVAARITGPVKTAFPNGAPAKEAATDKKEGDSTETKSADAAKHDATPAPHLAETKEPVNIIVIADTDMLQDRFWVDTRAFFGQRMSVPNSGNGSLVVSALDNLLGSNDLISVRNRGSSQRPFTRLKALQQDAEQQFLEKQQQLREQLRETERKLGELQRNKSGESSLILSPEQEKELARFREEKVKIRKDLRGVQHELRKDIERIEDSMKFLNIGLMPLVVGITGILVGMYRVRRKRNNQLATRPTQEAAA